MGALRRGERRQIPGVQVLAPESLLFSHVWLLFLQLPTSGLSTFCVLPPAPRPHPYRFSLLMCPDQWVYWAGRFESALVHLCPCWTLSFWGCTRSLSWGSLPSFCLPLLFILLPWGFLCSQLGFGLARGPPLSSLGWAVILGSFLPRMVAHLPAPVCQIPFPRAMFLCGSCPTCRFL